MEKMRQTVVIGGQSRLPQDLFPDRVLQLVVELEETSGNIKDVAFIPPLPVVQNLVLKQMNGMNIVLDLAETIKMIEERVHHRSRKAIIAAIRDLLREYRELREVKEKQQMVV